MRQFLLSPYFHFAISTMKDISIYFKSVNQTEKLESLMLGNQIQIHFEDHFPELNKEGIAIIYVPEFRNNVKHKDSKYSNDFRTQFYRLYAGSNWSHKIYDLGTIIPGQNFKDTQYAISTVCQELIKKEIIPIVVGGTQDLTNSIFKAYEQLEQMVNLTTIDNQLDLGDINTPLTHDGWLSHVLLHKPCYLFNYTNIGAQGHYISGKTADLFNDLYFDVCRLGEINRSIQVSEPFMRNTDILSFDLTSIRASDLQNSNYTAPNGIFAHEACQLTRYAGISDKLSSFGIFNYYSNHNLVTDELVAQLIWYFNEGYAQRKGDFPIGSKKSYTKFRVYLEELNEEIIFYKSDKSGRWWIEVPYPGAKNSKFMRHQMIPCSYETYQESMQGEIPDLWWKTYQKMV
ncbi:formimidoylglutamase [Brumimicrobium aurantiacum]|uniref:Arginase n=1 Tax=Brumimicrobium aurantiacum TaxID=1737063 RepID=A0A3E1EV55_9FLAO|nr:formimidoylglutamase [Brumimicrobium aurantiacum]RFC53437.1 arginase [Brumimicrobium aurantiacum]